ncbi:type II toxin-antitoxin system VapC family toxin [Leptospira interrogans]|uniref:type II toxin-antitoxin system VapC family toxin n=1 Tax=Leptospira interrogans TaxID=173 RepID=UPI0002E4632E|nr:type II toxin-antitoxin system VapC family toxin [Leptospira interrogans]
MSGIQRVYVDNSVYGGYFDKEFAEWTIKFFHEVDQGKFKLVISPLVTWELRKSPLHVRKLYLKYAQNTELIKIGSEPKQLALSYLNRKVVGKSSKNDCLHIAVASIAKMDVLVSWNFKHIVNVDRIKGYNLVNKEFGYFDLEIRTPGEVLHYE